MKLIGVRANRQVQTALLLIAEEALDETPNTYRR